MEAEAAAGRMEVIAFHGTPNATGDHADAVPEAPLGWHLAGRLRCRFHAKGALCEVWLNRQSLRRGARHRAREDDRGGLCRRGSYRPPRTARVA